MQKTSASVGLGSLATGAVTALALAVQTGLAAVVGVNGAGVGGSTDVSVVFYAENGVVIE